jgi:hypothetical protein
MTGPNMRAFRIWYVIALPSCLLHNTIPSPPYPVKYKYKKYAEKILRIKKRHDKKCHTKPKMI